MELEDIMTKTNRNERATIKNRSEIENLKNMLKEQKDANTLLNQMLKTQDKRINRIYSSIKWSMRIIGFVAFGVALTMDFWAEEARVYLNVGIHRGLGGISIFIMVSGAILFFISLRGKK